MTSSLKKTNLPLRLQQLCFPVRNVHNGNAIKVAVCSGVFALGGVRRTRSRASAPKNTRGGTIQKIIREEAVAGCAVLVCFSAYLCCNDCPFSRNRKASPLPTRMLSALMSHDFGIWAVGPQFGVNSKIKRIHLV